LPTVKLVRKERVGARTRRRYDAPHTRLDRVRVCAEADRAKATLMISTLVTGDSGGATLSDPSMKLLFDQNLSHRLVAALADVFPGSVHVRDVGLARAADSAFQNRGFVEGFPPKIVWLRAEAGSCSTAEIESLLRRHASNIERFERDPSSAVLILG
jgi:predicted nuclease of predicted toxin-antitoxin system